MMLRLLIAGLLLNSVACSLDPTSGKFEEARKASSCSAEQIKTRFIVTWEDGTTTVETAENTDQFIANFMTPNLEKIKKVEYDKVVTLGDPESVDTSASTSNWGQDMIEVNSAYSQGFYGQGISVAVVDAAVDYYHPQIFTRLKENTIEHNGTRGVDDDGNGYIDDDFGWDFFGSRAEPNITLETAHGSHVAGIILADHDEGPVRGMAPKADLVPVNFMNEKGNGRMSDAMLAIKYSVARGAKVINASWGGDLCSLALKTTFDELAAQNVLVVVAAGNGDSRGVGIDLDITPEFPAVFSSPTQITVAAARSTDIMTGWSNHSFNLVQLAAPGESIYSTIPQGYGYMSGTSMAAPFVAGAAALIWSAKPTATAQQVRQALLDSVDVRAYRVQTRGRLNVRKALDLIRK